MADLHCSVCGDLLLVNEPDRAGRCVVCHLEADIPQERHLRELQGTLADVQMEIDRFQGKQWKDI